MSTELDALRRLFEPLQEAERRASDLQGVAPEEGLFFGLVGIKMEPEAIVILDGHVTIRRVTNPPGIVHVFGAARRSTSDYLAGSALSG